jgi:preprotein translocase subunit SecB
MIVDFANLQLEGYYVEHMHYSARRVDEENLPSVDLTPGLHVRSTKAIGDLSYNVILSIEVGQHLKDASRFLVVLRVESDEEENRSPYLFDVTLVGYFRSQVEPSDTLRPHLTTNAAMILYSSARELLASITGRGPFPALVLPTLRFDTERETRLLRKRPVSTTSKRRATKKVARKSRTPRKNVN